MNTLLIMVSIFIVTIFFVNVMLLNFMGIPFSGVAVKTLLWADAIFGFFFTVTFIIVTRK